MKKINSKGFMLAETLIVSVFVAGVLIFLYIQFFNLNNSYDESYMYNTVEGLYSLQDIREYIKKDGKVLEYIKTNIDTLKYIDITDCSLFKNSDYCLNLFKLEKIKYIFITTNSVPKDYIRIYNDEFYNFISKINYQGNEKYRIVAAFYDSTYATIRFGE